MTVRGVLKLFLSVIGIFLLIALWRSGGGFSERGGYYLLGMVMAAGGAMPREVGLISIISALLFAAASLMDSDIMGMGWGHVIFCLITSAVLFSLAQPDEQSVFKCPRCYWRGPGSYRRFGSCPICGNTSLKKEDRSVITHA